MAELDRLLPKPRGKGRLKAPVEAAEIPANRVEVPPVAGVSGGSVNSPLTEQPYTGTTFYQLVSSDGLFVFEYAEQTPYEDAAGTEIIVIHRDESA